MYRPRDQVLEKSWLRSAELAPAIRIYMSSSTGAGARRRNSHWGMKMQDGLRNSVAGLTAGRRARPWKRDLFGGELRSLEISYFRYGRYGTHIFLLLLL